MPEDEAQHLTDTPEEAPAESVEADAADTPEVTEAEIEAEIDETSDDVEVEEPVGDESVEEPDEVEDVSDEEPDEVEPAVEEPVAGADQPDEADGVDADEPDVEPDVEPEPVDDAEPEDGPAAEAPADADVRADVPADAEATPEDEAPEEPKVGRARLVDALIHLRRGQAAAAVLLCILGFAAVLQVRTNDQDNSYTGQREQDLIDILSGLAGTTQKAQGQLETLTRTREQLRDQTSKQRTALERAQQQVATLRVIAGTVPVSGPGITITIEPGTGDYHLVDYLDLVEELRTQGAEAMAINGKVRLVASTSLEVSDSVPGLVVDGKLISPPFEVKVIGRPEALKGAVTFSHGPQDQLEDHGAKVRVTESEKIKIEAVRKTDH